MKFTEIELKIMELLWNSFKPLYSPIILKLSPSDKLWKDNSLHITIQTLQQKNAMCKLFAGVIKHKIEPVYL